MAEKGRNFLMRVGTAAVLIVVVAAGVILSPYSFLVLVTAVCVGAIWEFLRLAGHNGAQPPVWYTMAVGAVAVVLAFLVGRGEIGQKYFLVLIPLISILFIAELYRKKDNPLINISVSIGSLVYIAVPFGLLCLMACRDRGYDPWLILSIVGITAVNDTFAYLTGVLIGRHRLFERISPKKSWEGFAGGLVFATAAAVLCGWLMGENLAVWGGAGLVIVGGAVLGDLVESLFKRSAGVKDSGNILPGHGGFLDRIDALIFVIPLVFVYFNIFAV